MSRVMGLQHGLLRTVQRNGGEVVFTTFLAGLVPILVSVLAPDLWATPQGEPDISFEVISVRPSPVYNRTQFEFPPGGRFIAHNTTVHTLVVLAYDAREFQIKGEPGWMNADRYDISAKPARPLPAKDEMRTMLRGMLRERFKLVVREETREMPVYALVVGKDGSRLRESSDDSTLTLDGGRGRAVGTKVTMALFSQFLSQQVDRGVVDRTGLTGRYDVKLSWTPDVNPGMPDGGPLAQVQGPSLFSALQEQMGLRLESQRGPVKFFVVTGGQRPTEN
jgi:uncharacterized protein (TIGR03435 family)